MDERSIPIEGTCDPAFAAVRDEFEQNFRKRGEIGAAVCVYRDGSKVVDLWGGHKDLARAHPWREDTIVIMNSVAKSMCALCTHILIDRGRDRFRCAGGALLAGVRRRRQGGRAGAPRPVAHVRRDLLRSRAARLVVRLGGPHSRHRTAGAGVGAGHQGRLQLDQHRLHPRRDRAPRDRKDRRHFPARGRDRQARRGLPHRPAAGRDRARLRHARNPKNTFFKIAADPSTPLGRAFRSAPKIGYFQNCREIREREVPSFGGHGNARAVARIYAMLAGDGSIDGVRILSPAAVERAAQLVWEDDCIMTQRRIRMGYGFMHNEPDTVPMGTNMKAFGHTGTGGAFAWCDRDRNLAFAYCTNFQREGPGIGPRGAALASRPAAASRRIGWSRTENARL